MNLLIEIDTSTGPLLLAKKRQVLGGKQYSAAIMAGGAISRVMDMDGGYRASVSNLRISDPDRKIRNRAVGDTGREILTGQEVRIYDETGTKLITSVVESWHSVADGIEFRFTDRVRVKSQFTKTVLEGPWNEDYINPEVRKAIIPMVFNTYQRVVAPLVDNRVTAGGIWLLGNRPITSATRFEVGNTAINSSFWNLQNDGTYWWVKMSHGVIMGPEYGNPQFAYIDVTTPAYTPVQIITSILSGVLTVGTNAAFSAWLASRGFNSTNVHYVLENQKTPEQALQDFCRNFNCSWRLDENNEVVFEFIDRTSIQVQKTFTSGIYRAEIPGGITGQDFLTPETIRNRISYRYDWNPQERDYRQYTEFQGADTSEGVHQYSADYEYIQNYPTIALGIAQETYEMNRLPSGNIGISTSYELGKDINPGSQIRVQHRNLRTTNPLYGVAVGTAIDPARNTVKIEMKDIDFIYPYFILTDEIGIPICFDGELLLVE